MSVQGIGWNGVPDHIKAPDVRYTHLREGMASTTGAETWRHDITLAVLSTLGDGFRQRVFTSREVNKQPVLVGAPPARYEMRSTSGFWPFNEENSTTGNRSASSKQIERGASRQINGEELNPPVRAVLTNGEAGHAGKLTVSPIDAAIAVAAGEEAFRTSIHTKNDFRTGARHGALPLTIDEIRILEDHLPGQRKGTGANTVENRLKVVSVQLDKGTLSCVYTTETPNEARARWQNQKTDENSYHSAIPGNPAHAAGVTAYDLSLGAPLLFAEGDKAYVDYLRAVADWRTDWKDLARSDDEYSAMIVSHLQSEKTSGAILLVKSNMDYYQTGLLPSDIAKDNVATIARPKLIVSQTVAQRKHGQSIE